jgi:predicted 2-oxoglutarate/Fe(II)-dependent dioxygenase YbiX
MDLSEHVDDSEVTLNVCLGKEFQGGSLYFKGIKGTESEYKENIEYNHKVGKAVLHVGKHIHGANKIESGERVNLIIWCRASSMRKKCLSC